MKIFISLALVVSAVPLWSGVRIKAEEVDLKTTETDQNEFLLDTGRFRANAKSGSVLFLTDGGRNRMVMLDRATNEYREMDKQTMDQLSQQMQGALTQLQAQLQNLPPEQRARVEQMMRGRGLSIPQAQEIRTTYTATGSGSVAGFTCTKYEGRRGSEKVAELCAAKAAELGLNAADFQVFEKMRDFTASFTGIFANLQGPKITMAGVGDQGYQGFAIERTDFEGGQATRRSQLKSLERASFTDADFSLGNAKKVDLIPSGGFGGGRRR